MNVDSFVVVISRKYPIARCLKAIANANIPRKDLYLLLYLDTKDKWLIDYCKNWIGYHGQKWLSAEMIITDREPVNAVTISDYRERWQRIAENMQRIITHVNFSDIVFMVEDDTIIPKQAFTKLYRRIKRDKEIGCIQGVEAMRNAGDHGHCGAWKMRVNAKGKVKNKIGLAAKEKGIEEIDGGGYYCWAFRREVMEEIKLRSTWNGWCGPDLWTWYDIGVNGWKTLIDWSVWCIHMGFDDKENLKEYTPALTRNWFYDYENGTDNSPKVNFNYEM